VKCKGPIFTRFARQAAGALGTGFSYSPRVVGRKVDADGLSDWKKNVQSDPTRTSVNLTAYVAPANSAGMVVLVDPFQGADMKRASSLRSSGRAAPMLWRTSMMNIRFVACAAVAIATAMPAAAQVGETVTLHFEQAIPNIPGKSLVAQFVDYAPGGASLPHAHAKSAFIFAYVLSGEIESQVNDEPKRVYRAGESWYETPGSIHRVSRNASTTRRQSCSRSLSSTPTTEKT
jgi:quercetin dioxygenase-like cupin family protein